MLNEPSLSELDVASCLVRALVLYSLAEFQSGHCTTIHVVAENGSFRISDDGRGHAIERTVAGLPYLSFIYTHLEYPFVPPTEAPIQLHGIGMSLINVLCSELAVVVHKPDATLRMSFRNGALRDQEVSEARAERTGNTISGTVVRPFSQGFDGSALNRWLRSIKTSAPSLKLHFNGQEVHALSQSDA